MCVTDLYGRVNISWDPLPCHLQNGADITGYIIQYSLTSSSEARNFSTSSSDRQEICRQEPGGPSECIMPSNLITISVVNTVQVAASNSYGVGPFSDPVITPAAPNVHSMLLVLFNHISCTMGIQ